MNKNSERKDLNALLECLFKAEHFAPDLVVESEKPDFIIEHQGRKIGIETTRAVAEEFVRAFKVQAAKHPLLWMNISNLKNRSTRRSNKDLENSMGSNGLLQPWRQTVIVLEERKQKISKVLNSKRQKLNQKDFQRFDENWLHIYDYPPLPDYECDLEIMVEHIGNLLSEPTIYTKDFDCVFIHSGKFLFRWRNGALELCVGSN